MTRKSPRKSVDAGFWEGCLRQARAFRDAARNAMAVAGPGHNCSPVVSQLVLATIAYGDALTAKRSRIVNQQDHAAAPRLLRGVLRDTLPESQERRYRRLLGRKDEAQYGIRSVTPEDAKRLMDELEAFSVWAEDLLAADGNA